MIFIKALNEKLRGLPDNILTLLLIILAIVLVIIALRGTPLVKALAAAWVIAP